MKTSSQMRAVKLDKSFAFIAHYVEVWNWFLNFRIFSFLHQYPERRWVLYPLYPLAFVASVWYLFGRKPFNVVDSGIKIGHSGGETAQGYTILIRNFAWHFMLANYWPAIKERIMRAALYAQDTLKVDTIGLGALLKAEWLTKGGLDVAADPRIDVARTRIVHGDTATAWFVALLLETVFQKKQLQGPIAVIGPTSKIGRAVMLYLAKKGYSFLAFTDSPERFAAIWREADDSCRDNLHRATSLAQLATCSLWLIGKAKPNGKRLIKTIPSGAYVINFSVPDPLTPGLLYRRPDIRHFDGGLATLPAQCKMSFSMRLKLMYCNRWKKRVCGFMYACWVGTLIHTVLGWDQHEVGEVSLDELEQVGKEAEKLGICLPKPTSHLRPVPGLQHSA